MMNTLFLLLACVGPTSRSEAEQIEKPLWQAHWREGGYDAVTSIYVFYRQLGIPMTYQSLAENDQLTNRPAFAAVLKNARENGVRVSLRKCTLEELHLVPLPAVIHLDSERESSVGEFVVLIAKSGDTWTTVNGAQGCLGTISEQVLIRQWSGFVMFAQTGYTWLHMCGIGILGLLSGMSVRFANPKRFLQSRGKV